MQGGLAAHRSQISIQVSDFLTRSLESLECGSREATVLKTSPAPSPEGHGARRARRASQERHKPVPITTADDKEKRAGENL